jgi:hypothetical protein
LWCVFLNERGEASHLRGLRQDSKAGAMCTKCTGEAGSGHLASDEQGEKARLSDRDRISVPEPRKTNQKTPNGCFLICTRRSRRQATWP